MRLVHDAVAEFSGAQLRRNDEVPHFVGAIAYTERAQHRGHVDFRRRLGDVQGAGGLFVGPAAGDERQNLALAFRQPEDGGFD